MPRRFPPLFQLPGDVLIADDGPCDQLGKEGNIGPVADEAPLGQGIPPVYVDGVGHILESIKGDPDGEGHAQRMQETQARETGKIERQKIIILEEKEQAQVDDGVYGKNPSGFVPVRVHQQARGVVDGDGQEHEHHVDRLAPAVKHQVHREEPQISPARRDQVIDQQRDRQVKEQKQEA